jgi:hypothetical protein
MYISVSPSLYGAQEVRKRFSLSFGGSESESKFWTASGVTTEDFYEAVIMMTQYYDALRPKLLWGGDCIFSLSSPQESCHSHAILSGDPAALVLPQDNTCLELKRILW